MSVTNTHLLYEYMNFEQKALNFYPFNMNFEQKALNFEQSLNMQEGFL